MSLKSKIRVRRIEEESALRDALLVMQATYRDEKNWVSVDENLVSKDDLHSDIISWFVADVEGSPVGVLRVLYELPVELYKEYGFKMKRPGVDVDAFLRENKVAEIGRFAVLPDFRGNMFVVAALMKAATFDTVKRGFTHYITDVFEGERHSPYDFHTRVMGFQVVATHDTGELNCPNRRLTMLLDLSEGYHKLKNQSRWVFRHITGEWTPEMHQHMLAGREATVS
jgi:ribosomal protein S18 acetylase RimI-like enzyme